MIFAAWFALSVTGANAQALTPRVEIGGGPTIAAVTFAEPAGGATAWVDLNVARPLALEVRATWLPTDTGYRNVWHVAAGIRATFVRSSRFTFYGAALPGALHGQPTTPTRDIWIPVEPPSGEPILRFTTISSFTSALPPTHFVLDLTTGLDIALSSHLAARIELARDLHAIPSRTFTIVDGTQTDESPIVSPIGSRWNLHMGLTLGMGSIPRGQPPDRRRWTFGPMGGYTVVTNEAGIGTLGGFVSYRWREHCDFDGSVNVSLQHGIASLPFQGGRMFHAAAGVKLGTREGRIGVFFKTRAGIRHDDKVLGREFPLLYVQRTFPVLEIGGVVEFSVSPHVLLRLDLGESLSFVRGIVVEPDGSSRSIDAREEFYSLPLQVGFGVRF